MTKLRLNTKRHIHAARLREKREAKEARPDSTFAARHSDQMRKMLKGIDLDRYERLADGEVH